MAELKNPQEPALPSKRNPDKDAQEDPPTKAPKLASLDPNSNHTTSATVEETESNVVADQDPNDNQLQNDDLEDQEDEDEDDDEEEEEEEDGEAEVDRKGKGVMRDDKGKGKLIEEEDDDDDDDDDSDGEGGGSGEDDSDFSDDPLAEVDLNNILPSRTRRRTSQPGLHIADSTGNADDDDDDDDDSDA